MVPDIEKALSRELREVAGRVRVPPVPRLPDEAPRPARRRAPLLAAAAVLAVVTAATGVMASLPDGADTGPAQPSPAPSPSSPTPTPTRSAEPAATIPTDAPAVPYVLDRELYVDGEHLGGSWWSVQPAGEAWIAVRGMPLTWWWGRGAEQHELSSGEDVSPKISPNGRYVAVVRVENGEGILTVVDTQSGQNLEGTPTNFGQVRPAEGAYVTAVTNDGTVVIRRGSSYATWSADLMASTLSGQMVLDSTSAGVVAGDVDGARPYLAEISTNGTLTRLGDLPEHDDLVASPGGEWLAWTPAGTTGGEVTSVPSLQLGAVAGGDAVTLTAPEGWEFVVRTYAWEDDTYLVSAVSSPEHRRQRMARCSAVQVRCTLVQTD